jgi:hypothetical protein
MHEERTKNLIAEWRNRSHGEDSFSAFVFIWFSFNAWLEFCSSDKAETDRAMLEELKSNARNMNSLVKAYNTALTSEDRYFMQGLRCLISKTNEKPITKMRTNKEIEPIKDTNDFANVVENIDGIRCNLFHGGKAEGDERDQVLVKNSAIVLQQWIGKLITSWG